MRTMSTINFDRRRFEWHETTAEVIVPWRAKREGTKRPVNVMELYGYPLAEYDHAGEKVNA
jgi:hypothetical protein